MAAGQWQGELASYVVNRVAASEIEHRLRADDGSIRRLRFSGPITLAPGTRLTVWGRADGEAIAVDRYQVDADGTGGDAGRRRCWTGRRSRLRRWAFVLLDIDGGGNDINKANAQNVLFSPDRPDSIRSYFREVSYGVQDLEGEVFGPLPYQMGGRCDTDRVAAAMTPMIPGSSTSTCGSSAPSRRPVTLRAPPSWGGRIGRPGTAGTTRSASATSWCRSRGTTSAWSTRRPCAARAPAQPVPIAWPDEPGADCKHVEYGNPFDPMGGGDCNHMNGVQKAYQDWLGGCNVIKATSSGTFTIQPLASACDGPQLLQIPFPTPRQLPPTSGR